MQLLHVFHYRSILHHPTLLGESNGYGCDLASRQGACSPWTPPRRNPYPTVRSIRTVRLRLRNKQHCISQSAHAMLLFGGRANTITRCLQSECGKHVPHRRPFQKRASESRPRASRSAGMSPGEADVSQSQFGSSLTPPPDSHAGFSASCSAALATSFWKRRRRLTFCVLLSE